MQANLAIEHGYERAPLCTMQQALWFRMVPSSKDDMYVSPAHFWIQDRHGKIWALRFHDLAIPPSELLPGIGAALENCSSPEAFSDCLNATWLFPPSLDLDVLHDASIAPDITAIQGAVYDFCYRQGINSMTSLGWTEWHKGFDLKKFCLPGGVEGLLENALLFREGLDVEILEFLGTCPEIQGQSPPLAIYNTIQVLGKTYRRYRMQALSIFPWLSSELGLDAKAKSDAELLDAIDNGRELLPLLAERYGVSKATFRRAHKLFRCHTLPAPYFKPLLWLIDAIPSGHRPAFTDDFDSMHEVLEWAVRWEIAEEQTLLHELATDLFSRGPKDAVRRLRAWCPSLGMPFRDSDHYLGDILDCRYGNVRSRFTSLGRQIIRNQLLGSGVRSYLDAAERWHRAWVDDGSLDTNPNACWEPCLRAPMHLGQRDVIELHDGRMLKEEGQSMRHCVGSHWRQCMSGYSMIFSLRDQVGKRQSTLHVNFHEAMGFEVKEHRGFANGPASPGCQESAQLLLRWLNEERIEIVRERLQNVSDRVIDEGC